MPNSKGSPSKKVADLAGLLTLLTIPGLGPGRIRNLLSALGSPEKVLTASPRVLLSVSGIDRKTIAAIQQGGDRLAVQFQLKRLQEGDVQCIPFWHREYPNELLHINDPPLLLFYRGKWPTNWQNSIAVVGTRDPSSYGKSITLHLVRELTRSGLMIISGMARGIDSIAHDCCIREGGQTHAVLGCGVDRVYPAENRPLYRSIVSKGSLISEFLLGTGPDAPHFPRRNRIISGLCKGVVVVEAGRKSGALITAHYALEQNREVMAVPGNINNPRSEGPNYLIAQGAKLISGVDDILEEFIDGGITRPDRQSKPALQLTAMENDILKNLSSLPTYVDQLVLRLDQSPAVILANLLGLELKGVVRQLPGKRFVLA